MATHLKHPIYYPNTYIEIKKSHNFYTCAGCDRKRKKYVGEMYIIGVLGHTTRYYGTVHKYCCSEKCYYFAWLKYIDVIHPQFKNNPQLLTEPEEYIEF
jgi:hypothetical protein